MPLDGSKETLESMLEHTMENWLLFQHGSYGDAVEVISAWSKRELAHYRNSQWMDDCGCGAMNKEDCACKK